MTEVMGRADFLLAGARERHEGTAAHRALAPVRRITLPSGGPAWLVTGYHEVRAALADLRLAGRTGAVADRRGLPDELWRGMNTHMLNLEPPDHTRLRRLISPAFTRPRMERLRPRIQEITDELLDGMAEHDEVDLIEKFALPLPIRVLCELIGIPEEDADAFHGWTATLTGSALPLDAMADAAGQMLDYTRSLLARKLAEPTDDLLSMLAQTRDGADRLTEPELTSMVFLLLIAGHETTVNLIGNAVVALVDNPDQLAALRADDALVPAAIEELLRFESPVQFAMRAATEDIKLAGVAIPRGGVVMLSLLGANRDPARFADADGVRLDRADNQQMAFGHGIHHCLGAPLARMDGAIALRSLFARYPDLRLAVPAEQLTWRVSMVMHGIEALPVRLR